MITLALDGTLVGILSSVSGLGGGFMIVPLLIFLGREAKLAVGTSFVFILVVAISSIFAHYRLGNVDIVVLLLQSGAQVDATTKDLYTALHIAAKEGQEEVSNSICNLNTML